MKKLKRLVTTGSRRCGFCDGLFGYGKLYDGGCIL